jgi:hypothetical protein
VIPGFAYLPVAFIRLAWVGSVPRVTLTVIPGLRAAMVAFWPLTMISVKGEIVRVFAVLLSVTVTVLDVTLVMRGDEEIGDGVLFFLPLAKAGTAVTIPSKAATTQQRR